MQRILVDLDNSVNLLQMLVYKKMGYSSYTLENPGRPCLDLMELRQSTWAMLCYFSNSARHIKRAILSDQRSISL